MMRMRARSWALRDKFADVLRGLHSAEEMIDVSPRADSSPPPEPRRAQFVDIVEQGASDADQPDHDPETGEVAERPWAIPDSVVGLEARRKCLMDLLTMARVKVDVDEIQAEHQEFIDKLGRAKAEVLRALDNRRLELPERLEVEA
jgi:hypothetical protein